MVPHGDAAGVATNDPRIYPVLHAGLRHGSGTIFSEGSGLIPALHLFLELQPLSLGGLLELLPLVGVLYCLADHAVHVCEMRTQRILHDQAEPHTLVEKDIAFSVLDIEIDFKFLFVLHV